MESAAVAQSGGAVDLAIIGAMADGGLRREEAAALTWGDVPVLAGRHGPRPARYSAGWPPNTLSLLPGVRPDRRDAGQPDTCRSQSCRPGRRLLRAQRAGSEWPD